MYSNKYRAFGFEELAATLWLFKNIILKMFLLIFWSNNLSICILPFRDRPRVGELSPLLLEVP